MISWYRIIYYLGLAVIEATPPALLLTVAGGDSWGTLVLVVLAGMLADWIILRRIRPSYQGGVLAALGLLSAFWVVKGQVAGVGLFGGWGRAAAALADVGARESTASYLCMVLGLYCFWRGTRLTLHDSVTLHRLFRLSTILLMMVVFVRFFSAGPELRLAELASTEVVSFFAIGLLTMALASASAEREGELRRMGWRGMATLVGAVLLVIFLGVLAGALFGREAARLIGLLWQAVVLIIALIVAPFVYLLAGVIEWLVGLLDLERFLSARGQPSPLDGVLGPQNATEVLGIFPAWLQLLIRGFFALLPILIIISLFLLARRRSRRDGGADEERESLWAWSDLASDLRRLLAQLNPAKRAEGLRDALARQRGSDPASRIRRSYIRLLLLGEARGQSRAAPQTPREYAPTAGMLLPGAAPPIDALTEAYERARYHPASATAADAATAEQSWSAIEQAGKQRA